MMLRVIETTSKVAERPTPGAQESDALVLGRVAILALLLAAPALVWFVLPYAPVCPFRATFGLPCPGCGLGHGLGALFSGHLGAAIIAYPALVPLVLGYVMLIIIVVATLGRRPPRSMRRLARGTLLLGVVSGATLGIQWLMRLLI